MLGDRYFIEIKIDDEVKLLKVNFGFLKNINSLLIDCNDYINPFSYLISFIDEPTEGKIIDIIYCMLNGKISISKLEKILEEVDKEELIYNLKNIISLELGKEDIFSEENEEDSCEDEEEESELKKFIRFWDNNYYIALYQLNVTYKKFLNMSPRELFTLNKLHCDYMKNIILQRDVELQRAKNNVNKVDHEEENVKVIKCKRLKDIFI